MISHSGSWKQLSSSNVYGDGSTPGYEDLEIDRGFKPSTSSLEIRIISPQSSLPSGYHYFITTVSFYHPDDMALFLTTHVDVEISNQKITYFYMSSYVQDFTLDPDDCVSVDTSPRGFGTATWDFNDPALALFNSEAVSMTCSPSKARYRNIVLGQETLDFVVDLYWEENDPQEFLQFDYRIVSNEVVDVSPG